MAKSQVKRKGTSQRKKNLEKQMQRDPNLAARIEAEEEARRQAASLKKAEREELLNRVKEDPEAAVNKSFRLSDSSSRISTANKGTPSAPKKPSKPALNSKERRERFRKRVAAAIVIAVVMALIVTLALVVVPSGDQGGVITTSLINNLTGVGFERTS